MEGRTQGQGLEKNALSFFDAVMAGLSQMAPAFSILFTVPIIAGIAGASVPLIFVLGTIGILATANALSQFSRDYPSAGSFVTFIARAIGPRMAVFVAATALLGYIVAFSGQYYFGGYYIATEVFRAEGVPLLPQLCTLVFATLVTVPVIFGVRFGIRVAIALYLAEVAIFLAFSAAVLLQGGTRGLSLAPFTLPAEGLGPVALGFTLVVFAFIGFEAPAPLAEETREPRKNVPLALAACVLLNGALYVLASYAFVVAFADPSALAGDNSPFVTASQRFAPFLAPLVVVALLTSISSSFVAANTEIARVVYNTAREGLLPRALGRLHLRYRTPAVAVVAFVAPSVVIALVASVFADALTAAGFVGTLGTLAVILMYAMTNVALIVHWARGEAGGERGSIFFRLVVPVVGLAILGVPLWYNLQPDQDPPYNTIPILLPLILLGGLAYMLWVQRSRPQLLEQAGSIIMGERPADEAAVPTKERT